jgi:hypothetical protein
MILFFIKLKKLLKIKLLINMIIIIIKNYKIKILI